MPKLVTYQEAVRNQWAIAYHRIVYGREQQKEKESESGPKKQCRCEDCQAHFAAIKEE